MAAYRGFDAGVGSAAAHHKYVTPYRDACELLTSRGLNDDRLVEPLAALPELAEKLFTYIDRRHRCLKTRSRVVMRLLGGGCHYFLGCLTSWAANRRLSYTGSAFTTRGGLRQPTAAHTPEPCTSPSIRPSSTRCTPGHRPA